MTSAPTVSIVLPTFNRGDVIGFAVDSVLAQTYGDWELVVVDDGSTDGTADRIAGRDPRIRVVRQDNTGVYAARNRGLAESRGRLLTFLDSDDRWEPYYLELCVAFLTHHTEARFVTTEFWEDWGDGSPVRHDWHEVKGKYPRMARVVGSVLYALPPGETDDYLRVYSTREPIGEWGRVALGHAGLTHAYAYSGRIFPHMRFGYLNWLPTTMLTREALAAVGPFVTHTRSTADYQFLCRLARAFPAHMLAVPSATKYERAPGGAALAEGHLATGPAAYRFEVNRLGFFDELYSEPLRGDREIELLRRHICWSVARTALALGKRAEARSYLRAAAAWRRRLWRAYPAMALATLAPSDEALGGTVRGARRATGLLAAVLTGRITPARVLRRLRRGPAAPL